MNKGRMILKWVVFGALLIALIGWVTMMLWNWLVPVLFNGPQINFAQTLGLLLLTKILFSSMGGKHHCSQCNRPDGEWKHKLYNRFSSMTPEERELLKNKMKEKWCRYDSNTPDQKSGTSND
ncbi:MAG: hypothetical protein JNM57_04490 [Cyclobacteriaceae bacterium]|nr:hypothetical protein [Cyclobacteriaceae bacterium]